MKIINYILEELYFYCFNRATKDGKLNKIYFWGFIKLAFLRSTIKHLNRGNKKFAAKHFKAFLGKNNES